MPFLFSFAIAILLLIFGKQLEPRFLSRVSWKLLFLIAIGGVGMFLIFQSYLQYQAFQKGLIGPILGSQGGILWYLSYVRFHVWNAYLVSLLASLLFFLIAKWLNARRGGQLFYDEEFLIGSTVFFLVGYPGVLLYLAFILLVGILGSLMSHFFTKSRERFPLYFLWCPVGIFVILLIQFVLERQSWWASFRF